MSEELPTPPWPDPQDPLFRVVVERGLQSLAYGLAFAIVDAVAHGWMEGHVLAEQGRDPVPEPVFRSSEECPTPPFPAEQSREFREIVLDLLRTAEKGEERTRSGLVIAAAARGWAKGYSEGLSCLGCLPPGGERALALRVLLREGVIPIRPSRPPEEEAFFDAAVATYKEQLLSAAGRG